MGEPGAPGERPRGSELWCVRSLSPAERAQLACAFRRAPGLRAELEETVLAGLPEPVREQFAIALANRLAEAARPQSAVMPALIDTARALAPAGERGLVLGRAQADWIPLNVRKWSRRRE